MVTVVDNIEDIEVSQIMISEKKVNKWSWTDKNGVKLNKTQNFAEVYYKKIGNKCSFSIEDIKTRGIIVSHAYNRAFMGLKLSENLSDLIKDKIDGTLSSLLFSNRKELLGNAEDITELNMLKPIYKGIVQRGNLRDDGITRWDDELVATIPTKLTQGVITLDTNLCDVEDSTGSTFNWKSVINGCTIMECIIEIDKIILKDKITVKSNYRLVVPDHNVVQKVTTRKRINRLQHTSDNVCLNENNNDYKPTNEMRPLKKRKTHDFEIYPDNGSTLFDSGTNATN
jgi:hypothetical protein